MRPESMITTLKALKFVGMGEVAQREGWSVNYQMKAARFAAFDGLAGLDFNQSTVN